MPRGSRDKAPDWLDLAAQGGVSAALLALEVLLLRLFEFSHWYHFAGLAVSLALLGLGAAGTTLALAGRRQWVRDDGGFLFGLLLTGAGFLLLLALQSRVALRPLFAGWDAGELATVLLVDFIAFLPFYGAGLAIAQVFLRWPARPRSLYAANLLGSGLGSLGACALLALMAVETALALVATLLFALGVALSLVRGLRRTGAVAGVGLLLALTAVIHPPAPAVSDFKALSRIQDLPGIETLKVEPGMAGRLSLFRSDSLRAAPGLSLAWTQSIPPMDRAVIGSDLSLAVPRAWPAPSRHARASLGGLPLRLRPDGAVLALGSSDWQTPVLAGGRAVTRVEPDGRLLELARQRGAEKAGVELVENAPWRFLAHTDRNFAVIALDETWAGGDASTEDYLLTRAGLEQALVRLSERGLLAIPLKLNYPPRHYTRILSTLHEALKKQGVRATGEHVAVVRGMQALLILASPEPLVPADLTEIKVFAGQWRFDLAWLPELERASANRVHRLDEPLFFDIAGAVFAEQRPPREVRRFHTRAASLERPYPWRSLDWSKMDDILKQQGQRGWSYLDWTLLLSVATAAVAGVLALLLIIAPLGHLPPITPPHTRMAVFGYFLALGLGYMLLELALFQRVILYLGEPVLTASIVFAVFLIGSGLGSAMTPRGGGRPVLRQVFGTLMPGLAAALVPFLAVKTLSVPDLVARTLLIVLALVPLAWALGRPLPWGLARLDNEDRWIPWAWGINSFASVLGASIAPLVSVHLGQPLTLAAGASCYLMAFCIARQRLCDH